MTAGKFCVIGRWQGVTQRAETAALRAALVPGFGRGCCLSDSRTIQHAG